MANPQTARRELTEVAPSTACRDLRDVSSPGPLPAGGADTDPGTVAIVHPRVSNGVARALGSCGFSLVADTGSCQVWVRPPRPAALAVASQQRQPLTLQEAATHLNVSDRRLVAERRIAFVKWGHVLRFDAVEIQRWVDEARRPSSDR